MTPMKLNHHTRVSILVIIVATRGARTTVRPCPASATSPANGKPSTLQVDFPTGKRPIHPLRTHFPDAPGSHTGVRET